MASDIAEADDLVQLVLKGLPSSKPWQRQLRMHLSEVDRLGEVLRLTLMLKRSKDEVAQAANGFLAATRAANAYASGGRVDVSIRAALVIAFGVAKRICAAFDV